jgi:hypothetical protein
MGYFELIEQWFTRTKRHYRAAAISVVAGRYAAGRFDSCSKPIPLFPRRIS